MNELSIRLKELREENNLSAEALGRAISVTGAAIIVWEKGTSVPKADSLIKLAKYFRVSVQYLLGLEEYYHLKDDDKTKISYLFPKRLKELRVRNGVTQVELAKIVKTSDAAISSWEKDMYYPNVDIVKSIAIFFNVRADYLLGLED